MLSAIRNLTPDDTDSLKELSALAGWNQTKDDWLRLLRLSPEGCRSIADGDKIVASTTSLYYGDQLGWIGMVLTREEYRRKGLARWLIEDAIALAGDRGVRTLKLDATDQGRPLYESLGFVVEKAIERWGRDSTAPGPLREALQPEQKYTGTQHIAHARLQQDLAAFGVDRRELLEDLLATSDCECNAHGFILSRSGKTASYLGPCVAADRQAAHKLIAARLAHSTSQASGACSRWYWDMFPDDTDTVRFAGQLGFTRQRQLCRMRRGELLKNDDSMIYAVAGFELG